MLWLLVTLPEANIAPENRPLEKEIPIANHNFQVLWLLVSGSRVSHVVAIFGPWRSGLTRLTRPSAMKQTGVCPWFVSFPTEKPNNQADSYTQTLNVWCIFYFFLQACRVDWRILLHRINLHTNVSHDSLVRLHPRVLYVHMVYIYISLHLVNCLW